MAVVIMEDMVATLLARDLLMLNLRLRLILRLMLVSFMEDMVLVDMADMVLDTAVATSVVMEDMV